MKKVDYKYKDSSLITKAQKLSFGKKRDNGRRKPFTQAEIDLVYACIMGDVSAKQMCHTLGQRYYSAQLTRNAHWALKCQLLGL